ncbi:FeoB-associated Cys-rich membrane protein [Sphaerochaeta sp. PS]|uniref:FeoB-associated Cys-rich membrane protein n=1 Tax=Sphaerochaeta sp. PS TaxID=3076336 RepID=UPI003917D034
MINYVIAASVLVFLFFFTKRRIREARRRHMLKEGFSCTGDCSSCGSSSCH